MTIYVVEKLSVFNCLCVQRWNLRVRKPRVIETTDLLDEEEDDDVYDAEEDEEEAMEEDDEEEEEMTVVGGKGSGSVTLTSVNTSSTSASSAKKTPAPRKQPAKKRAGTELKAPPSKRKAVATTPATGGSGITPSRAQQPQSQQKGKTNPKKRADESRAQVMFQSVLSGKSALKVNTVELLIKDTQKCRHK